MARKTGRRCDAAHHQITSLTPPKPANPSSRPVALAGVPKPGRPLRLRRRLWIGVSLVDLVVVGAAAGLQWRKGVDHGPL